MRISNPQRVVFPDMGITKGQLAEYYASVAEHILPHAADRPLSIVRCPKGRTGKCFYQKHLTESLPDALHGVEIAESEGTATYISIRDTQGLIALVQFGVLEIHPWGSRSDRVERPDRIVLDLDPGPQIAWADVVDAAREMRGRLEKLGLESFVRTTGGKGLHVVVPIVRRNTWDEVKEFARLLCAQIAAGSPTRYVTKMTKSKRTGRIYLDYLRNGRGATAIASYSTRARESAPVAVPLAWDELSPEFEANFWTVADVPDRLAALDHEPWAGFFEVKQSLTKAAREAVQE